ncbi:MAG TPA: M48 family peptidase [Crenotrichaceae bacterium]|nr:M48 family peptidase [Crenotrichaceae bacterium]
MITRVKRDFRVVTLSVLLFCSGSPSVYAQGSINLPDFGDSSGRLITPEEERKFGKRFYEFINEKATLNKDLEVHEYIESLGQHLVKGSDLSQAPFHFFVVMDPAINAFAGPGGYIGINAGLILKSNREGELASVMAHEIAHVTQRHLYRAYEASKQLSVPATMATIASLLLGFVSPELAQAALIATQAGNIQYQINFTRDNEQEADRVGMQILSQSEYDPRNMVAFFETLQNASRLYGSGPPEFLRTHPLTTSRIADAAARAEKFPRYNEKDNLTYELIKTKLELVEQEDKPRQSSVVVDSDAHNTGLTGVQSLAEQYKQALIYSKTDQSRQALSLLRTLVQQHPEQLLFTTALASAEVQAGNITKAVSIWKKAYQSAPLRLSILMPYVQALLDNQQTAEARELLQHAIWNGARLPALYKALAQAYYKQNQKAQAHRYLGEYHHLRGELEEAVTQLRLAAKTAQDNFYMTEIVAEQLKQIRKEIKGRKEES